MKPLLSRKERMLVTQDAPLEDETSTSSGSALSAGRSAATSMFTDGPILAGLIVGVVLRIVWLGRQAWFVDEAAEFDIVGNSYRTVLTEPDGFPPLTTFVLKAWVSLFGPDQARLLPLAAGITTLVILVVIARRVWGRDAAVATAWLAALSPTLVWTSQEVRPYGDFVLVTTVAGLLAIRLIERPTIGRHLALGVGLGVGCWVHYFFPFPGGFLLLWAAWSSHAVPGFVRRFTATLGPLLVLALPVVPLVLDDLSFQQGFSETSAVGSGVSEIGYSSVSLLTGATVGPGLRALHGMPVGEALRQMAPWLALLVPALVLTVMEAWKRRRTDPALVALVGVVAGGIGLIAAVTLVVGTGYRPRYIVWATVPVLLVLGRVISAAPRRLAAVPAAALLVVFVVAIINRNYSDEHRVEAVDEALADIAASDHPDAPVLTVPGIELVIRLYRDDPAVIIPSVFGPDDLTLAIDTVEATADGGPAWIVYTRPFDHDRNGDVRAALADRGAVIYSRHAGVELIYLAGDESSGNDTTDGDAAAETS